RPAAMFVVFLIHQAAGLRVWPYHLANVALHAGNAVLLLRLLQRRYGRQTAALAAILFALLPIHVEAVAYASELPEVLMLTWILLAWHALEYPARPSAAGFGFFCLALLT